MTSWRHAVGRSAAAVACLLVVISAAALLVGLRPDDAAGGDPREVAAGRDAFGVRELNQTLRGGMTWTSAWQAERRFTVEDPLDPWFDTGHGEGAYQAGGGTLRIGGRAPRMYVHDPIGQRQWGDIEATVYARRIADSGISYAGITIVARSNHLDTDSPDALCDTRGYGARLRFDGTADFEKETAHPANTALGGEIVYLGGMPREQWIGVKFLVYDRPDGVHLELWTDMTGGRDGGRWRLTEQAIDDGRLFGEVPCTPGVDPRMALSAAPERTGSESGLPNLTVFFRSDGIAPQGLEYKWASVREITSTRSQAPGRRPSDER